MAKKKQEAEGTDGFTITRSFARKLNMSAHGGKQYETADIVCTITTVSDNVEETSKYLDELCQKEVEATIAALDGDAIEEVESAPVVKKKKTLDLGIKVEQSEIEGITEYVNDLTLAKTAEDLKAAVVKIKGASAKLTDDQKKYLSAYYLKRKDAIV